MTRNVVLSSIQEGIELRLCNCWVQHGGSRLQYAFRTVAAPRRDLWGLFITLLVPEEVRVCDDTSLHRFTVQHYNISKHVKAQNARGSSSWGSSVFPASKSRLFGGFGLLLMFGLCPHMHSSWHSSSTMPFTMWQCARWMRRSHEEIWFHVARVFTLREVSNNRRWALYWKEYNW